MEHKACELRHRLMKAMLFRCEDLLESHAKSYSSNSWNLEAGTGPRADEDAERKCM